MLVAQATLPWRHWPISWRGLHCLSVTQPCLPAERLLLFSLTLKMLPPWTGALSMPWVDPAYHLQSCHITGCMPSLCNPQPPFLPQAAQDWRSFWELNRPSWSFRRLCSVAHRWHWSEAFSPEKWTRSWTPASRSSSLASVRISFSNQHTSA